MRRRDLIALFGVAGAAAGCSMFTKTTVNGVTTLSIDLTKLQAWAKAFTQLGTLVLALPGVAASNPPVAAAIAVAMAAVNDAMISIISAAGSALVLTFDASSVPAAVQSLLADGKSIVSAVSGIVGLPDVIMGQISVYIQAGQAIVAVLTAAIGSFAATPSTMSADNALNILKVH